LAMVTFSGWYGQSAVAGATVGLKSCARTLYPGFGGSA
jgi:hypothetical protein